MRTQKAAGASKAIAVSIDHRRGLPLAKRLLFVATILLMLLIAGQAFGQESLPTQQDESGKNAAADQTAEVSSTTENESAENESIGAFDFFGDSSPKSVAQLREMQQRFREVAERAAPATVNIQVGNSQGSGVIVTRDGYIMTAAHVIGGANLDAIVVLNDGRSLKAKTLGLNRTVDSGLLKIVEKGKYPYLSPGESGNLKTGQWVMAIGHPGGLEPDRGLVYRVGRIFNNMPELISTDCSLVGGDSGGPLVDMDGNVIGIHSRIGQNLNSNIHVPVDIYNSEWDDLVSAKDWGRGIGGSNPANEPWLGLDFENGTLKIETITSGGPAEKAGLKVDDLLLEFNGVRLTSQNRLRSVTRDLSPGAVVKVKYKRGEETLETDLTVGSRADDR